MGHTEDESEAIMLECCKCDAKFARVNRRARGNCVVISTVLFVALLIAILAMFMPIMMNDATRGDLRHQTHKLEKVDVALQSSIDALYTLMYDQCIRSFISDYTQHHPAPLRHTSETSSEYEEFIGVRMSGIRTLAEKACTIQE